MLWLIHTINQSEEREKKRNALSVPANGDINVAEKRLCVNSCGKLKVLWKKLKFYPACLNLLLVNILHGRCSRPLPCVHKKKSSLELQDGSSPKQSPSTLQRILKPSPYMHFTHTTWHIHTHKTHTRCHPLRTHVGGRRRRAEERKKKKEREREKRSPNPFPLAGGKWNFRVFLPPPLHSVW